MKLGLLTSIMPTSSLEEVIEFRGTAGIFLHRGRMLAKGKGKEKICRSHHIDVEHLDDGQAARIKDLCRARNVEISSLAYYPNVLDEDENSRRQRKVILRR